MIVRCFGANRAQLGYVLSNKTAEVFEGDPALFSKLSAGIPFKQKIFSGVLAFTEPLAADNGSKPAVGELTRQQLKRILRQFRRVIAHVRAGMPWASSAT